MIAHDPSAAVISACRTADAVNLVLALQTLTEAEQVLRGRRSNLEDRLRHEAIHQAAKSKAEALLRHNNINPEIMWRAFL